MNTPSATPKAPDFGQGGRSEMLAVIQFLMGEVAALQTGIQSLSKALTAADDLNSKEVARAIALFANTEKRAGALAHYREILAADVAASQTPDTPDYEWIPRFRAFSREIAVDYVLNDLDSVLGDMSLSSYDAVNMARIMITSFNAENHGDDDTARAYASHLRTLQNRIVAPSS